VHGHTPVRHPELLKSRVNIDTGAYATGNLTLMTIQGTSMLAVSSHLTAPPCGAARDWPQ
jgi:serine/threonine protein phosphatase 1